MDRILSEAVTHDASLVMEGIHLLPEYVHGLLTKYGSANVHALFIGLVDVDRVTEGIMQNSSPDNWTRNSDPDVIKQIAEFVAAFSMHIQHETTRYGLPYRERTQDFEEDMKHFHERLLDNSEIKHPFR